MSNVNINAQNTLKGKIIDKKTKESLVGVELVIIQSKQGTISDIDGNFELKNIKQKQIDLKISYVGYEDIKKHISFTSPSVFIKIEMEQEVFDLDAVIVSTPFSKLQKDNVMKVSKRTTSIMEQTGAQNLMQGIAQIPGVSDLSTGTGINKPVIRGLSGNRVLVYNQGVRLENFQFGEEHGMGIDESGIEAVEVIKGPASLLYGSDALGGVIYLIPEKFAPKNKSQLNFKTRYSSNMKGKYVTLGYKKSFDKLRLLASGAIKQNGDYRFDGNTFVENSANQSNDVKIGLGYMGKITKTDIRYNFNRQKNGLPHTISNEYHSDITGKYQNLENQSISVKNDWKLNNSKFKTNIGFLSHQRSVFVNGDKKISMRLNTLNFDAKWYPNKFGKFESIIGVQGMAQTNKNFGKHYLLPDADIFNTALFGTVNYSKDNWVFQSGLRMDMRKINTKQVATASDPEYRQAIDKNLLSFNASFGLKTNLNKHFSTRLNIASGYRAPNLSELASKGLHDQRIEIGNADLKNEQNIQTDINLSYENTHFEFFANVFYNKLFNYIYLAPTGFSQNTHSIYQYKQSDAKLYGGEIGLHFHPHPWDWLHFDTSFETVTAKDKFDNYLPLIPADQWKNNLRIINKTKHKYVQKYYFNFSIDKTFKTTRLSNFEDKLPAYTLLNAGFGGTIKLNKTIIDFNISIHNITDKKYISHLSVLREDNIPNMGKNVVFLLKIKV